MADIPGYLPPNFTSSDIPKIANFSRSKGASLLLPDGTSPVTTPADPVVDGFSPAVGATIVSTDTVQFDVTTSNSLVPLSLVVVGVKFASTGAVESVYSGSAFLPYYSTDSTITSITDGYRFVLERRGGWPSAPSFFVSATSDNGGATTPATLYTYVITPTPYTPTFVAEVQDITVSGNAIIPDPIVAQDAASKNYVDTTTGPAILTFGATTTSNSPSTTTYILPGYGNADSATERGIIIPAAGKISKLYIKDTTGPAADEIVFTVRKNGSDQTLTATMSANWTTTNDTTHSFTVAAGDEVTVKAVSGASLTTGAIALRIGMEYTIG